MRQELSLREGILRIMAQNKRNKFPGVRKRSGSFEINYYINKKRIVETVHVKTEGEAYIIRLKRMETSQVASGRVLEAGEVTFEQAIEHYATVNEKILKTNTLQRSQCIYGHFTNFMKVNYPEIIYVRQLTIEQGLKYKDHLLGLSNKTPSGINTDISKLRAIFRKFKESRFIGENIFSSVSKIPSRQARPEKKHLPTDFEIKTILKAVKGDPSYEELTTFLVRVGHRVEETTLYEKKDVLKDEKGNPIKIVVRPEITKTKEAGEVPIDEELAAVIKQALMKHPNQEYLFTNFAERKISSNTYRDYLNRVCVQHGLNHITPHCFRYFVANKLINAGVNIKDAMAITGHTDVESFMSYIKTTEEGRQKALAITKLSVL